MAVPSPNTNGQATLPVPSGNAGPSRPSLAGGAMGGPSYSSRLGASPLAGGGMSIDQRGTLGKSYRPASGNPGSYGARFYGTGHESPSFPFSTSVNMDSSSFVASSAAFNLPPTGMSSSYRRSLSYAAAARGASNPANLSTSFASMSFQPMSMSFGNSYSKSQVHNLMANRPRTDAEITTAYECCGTTHSGLHALLEHVEDAHPFADDMEGSAEVQAAGQGQGQAARQPSNSQIGFSPQVLAMDLELEQEQEPSALGTIEERASQTGSQRSSMSPASVPGIPSYPVPTSTSSSKPATPGEGSTHSSSPAPLQISDILTSPFTESLLASSRPPSSTMASVSGNGTGTGTGTGTAASTSSSPPDTIATPSTSQHASPVFAIPKVNPSRGFLGSLQRPSQGRFERAFNEVVAGSPEAGKDGKKQPTAVAPGMLFANAVAGLGIPTQASGQQQKEGTGAGAGEEDDGEVRQGAGVGDSQLPQPSLFTTHKPWRCPNPGCNKAYKQSNGLKYHQQKGQCDFAIHDAVDLGLSLEEAEERSRPFVCAVGAGCLKRYRQMNGLKYHYLNSGEHGKYGLRMLQNGTHPQPSGVPPLVKKPGTPGSSTVPANTTTRPAGAPYQIPSQLGQTRPGGNVGGQGHTAGGNGGGNGNGTGTGHHPPPRMGVFPTHARPMNGVGGVGGVPGSGVRSIPGAPPGSGVRPVNGFRPMGQNGTGPAMGANRGPTGVPPSFIQSSNPASMVPRVTNPPPVQRGRDAVLFAAVETMDL